MRALKDKIGGPGAKLDKLHGRTIYYHDTIEFFAKSQERKIDLFRPLYEKGLSLREIEKQTGHCKTTIRKTLVQHGVAIRDFRDDHKKPSALAKVMRSGGTPFGFTYLEGALVMDPREYKVILQIYRLWTQGQSLRAIAKALTVQKIPTRHGRSWRHEVIKKIIDRHENQLKEESHGT